MKTYKQFLESYKSTRFRIVAERGATFNDIKNHPLIKKYSGPHTAVFDVTKDVEKAPGENKWNLMTKMFGTDHDEILCASTGGTDWICLAINIEL